MATVSIRGVRKSFGSTAILHGVDVEIADGEFTVLVGPSGCGKSTLLRMIAGLEEIDGGEIAIGGRVVNEVPPKQRDIAMVFQNYALYPHMTVRDNMAFSLQAGQGAAGRDRRAGGPGRRHPGPRRAAGPLPRQLCGGQRQRVAMGRAIVRDPQVFLFDEPLSNLDAKLRVQMRAELKDLHQRLRTTTIYVTHDQIEAMTMADQIVVMNGGRDRAGRHAAGPVRPPGQPVRRRLHRQPGHELPAGHGRGRRLPRRRRHAVAAADGARPGQWHGRRLWRAARAPPALAPGAGVPLTVQVVEPTGSETQVHGRVGSLPVMGAFRERVPASPGEPIAVTADPGLVHLFDRETGQALSPEDRNPRSNTQGERHHDHHPPPDWAMARRAPGWRRGLLGPQRAGRDAGGRRAAARPAGREGRQPARAAAGQVRRPDEVIFRENTKRFADARRARSAWTSPAGRTCGRRRR